MTICGWQAGTQRPSLKALLLLGYRLGISPSALLLGQLRPCDVTVDRPASAGDDLRLRPPLRKTTPARIYEALRAAIDTPNQRPLSLKRDCATGGFHQTQASNRFPELAKQVSDFFGKYLAEKRRQKEHFLKILIRSAVYEVCWSNAYPSRRRVQAKLPRLVSLRDPAALAEYRRVLGELDLVSFRNHGN